MSTDNPKLIASDSSESFEIEKVFESLAFRKIKELAKFNRYEHPSLKEYPIFWMVKQHSRKNNTYKTLKFFEEIIRISPLTPFEKIPFEIIMENGKPRKYLHSNMKPFPAQQKEDNSFSSQNESYAFSFNSPTDLKEKLQTLFRIWSNDSIFSSTRYFDEKQKKLGADPNQDLDTVISNEGHKKLSFSYRYERDPKLRQMAIEHYGTQCKACGFDFEKTYGKIGKDFIEVHHLIPLYQGEVETHYKNLIPLCSNCHRIIHRIIAEQPPGRIHNSLDILKNLLTKPKNN